MKSGIGARLLASHLLMVVLALAVFVMVLAGVADRQATAAGIRADQASASRLAPWLERYYRERGSWEGLARLLHDERFISRMPMTRGPMTRRGPAADPHMSMLIDQPILLLAPDGAVIAARDVGERIIETRRREMPHAVPIGDSERPIAYLFLGSTANPERNPIRQLFLQTMRSAAAITSLVVLAAVAVAALVWTRWLVQPLRLLSGATVAMAGGDYRTRVVVPPNRHELTELAASFNEMAAEIESQENARRQFIADAAHELRTPLSLLAARVEMLETGVYKPDAGQWQALRSGIERMHALVTELQMLARLEAGRLELTRATIAAEELLRQAAASFEPLAAERGVALRVDPPNGAEPPAVYADQQRVIQVLANLLSNALRYAPAGSRVVIGARCAQPDSFVEFSVEDEGPGIPAAERERIFQRFVRLEESRDRESGGSGLGLAIAAELVRRQGGTIRVEPGSGERGSRFVFTLPRP